MILAGYYVFNFHRLELYFKILSSLKGQLRLSSNFLFAIRLSLFSVDLRSTYTHDSYTMLLDVVDWKKMKLTHVNKPISWMCLLKKCLGKKSLADRNEIFAFGSSSRTSNSLNTK